MSYVSYMYLYILYTSIYVCVYKYICILSSVVKMNIDQTLLLTVWFLLYSWHK